MKTKIFNNIIKSIIISGTATFLLNSAIIYIASTFFNTPLAVLTSENISTKTISYIQIIPESYFIALLGIILYMALNHFLSNAWKIYVFLVIIITALWSLGPIMHGVNIISKICLSLSHVVIAASILLTVKFILIGKDADNKLI